MALTRPLTVLISTIFLLGVLNSAAAAEKRIRITNGEWEPYLSEYVPHYGVLSHIVTDAFALEGVTVEYGFFGWKRALELTRSGEWDAAAVWSYSEERARDFDFSEPVWIQEYFFFHLKDFDFDWNSYDDLAGISIGAAREYYYGPEFEEAESTKKIDVDRVGKDEQNILKLVNGRIQLAVLEKVVGYEQISNTVPKDKVELLTHHSRPVFSAGLRLLFSKKMPENKEMLEIFERGLAKLYESGAVEKYMQDAIDGKYTKQKEKWKSE